MELKDGDKVTVSFPANTETGVGVISYQAVFIEMRDDGKCLVWSTHSHREVEVERRFVSVN